MASVTVGVPVYNGEEFLDRCLESVLGQTHGDLEILVADNGSTDGTAEIAARFAARDRRITVLGSDRNRGAAWNFNRLAAAASGEFFKWWAVDDLCEPTFVERAVAGLRGQPAAALAHSEADFLDHDGRQLWRSERFLPADDWDHAVYPRVRATMEAVVGGGQAAMVIVYGLIRRSALASLRPLGNYYGADWVYAVELALAGEMVRLRDETMTFLRHRATSSHLWFDQAFQQHYYDPSVRGRLRVAVQYRRRHLELAQVVLRSRLTARQKASLLAWLAGPGMARGAVHDAAAVAHARIPRMRV